MFVVFADQASTANIYTHKFNIACMQCCSLDPRPVKEASNVAGRLLFCEN